MDNKIEKRIEIKAPVARVWKALTDCKQFGQWFGVKIEGPFVVGQIATGHITHPGYEHLKWEVVIKEMQTESLFSFSWHPYAVDPELDYSVEAPTLVEFRLQPIAVGTLLTVVESGFDKVPEHRRNEAFRMNEDGWNQQMSNIDNYVTTAQKA